MFFVYSTNVKLKNLKMLDVLQFLSYFMIFSIEFINCNISTTEKTCMTRPYVERWEKEYYPNPQNVIQEDYCGRGCKPSWICDPGHVITKEKGRYLFIYFCTLPKYGRL